MRVNLAKKAAHPRVPEAPPKGFVIEVPKEHKEQVPRPKRTREEKEKYIAAKKAKREVKDVKDVKPKESKKKEEKAPIVRRKPGEPLTEKERKIRYILRARISVKPRRQLSGLERLHYPRPGKFLRAVITEENRRNRARNIKVARRLRKKILKRKEAKKIVPKPGAIGSAEEKKKRQDKHEKGVKKVAAIRARVLARKGIKEGEVRVPKGAQLNKEKGILRYAGRKIILPKQYDSALLRKLAANVRVKVNRMNAKIALFRKIKLPLTFEPLIWSKKPAKKADAAAGAPAKPAQPEKVYKQFVPGGGVYTLLANKPLTPEQRKEQKAKAQENAKKNALRREEAAKASGKLTRKQRLEQKREKLRQWIKKHKAAQAKRRAGWTPAARKARRVKRGGQAFHKKDAKDAKKTDAPKKADAPKVAAPQKATDSPKKAAGSPKKSAPAKKA